MERTNENKPNLKTIYKDDSASIDAQIDLFLADILKQVSNIIEEIGEEVRLTRTLALKQYIRGYRDGFRLLKNNPYDGMAVVNEIY
jgi:hypothetical protein